MRSRALHWRPGVCAFARCIPRRYDHYDFIFDSEDRASVDGETFAERGWDLDNAGHVIIDYTCATDPKGIDPHRWTVRFKGLRDIQSGRFLRREFRRIPPKRGTQGKGAQAVPSALRAHDEAGSIGG